MSNEIVIDIETQNTFRDVGDRDVRGLKISVVGVYTYANDHFVIYTEDELSKLWPLLEHADRIIGFNHRAFDMRVLNNYYAGDCTRFPLLDMMEEVVRVLGFRPKLNDLVEGTLGKGKSGNGLDAIRYWKEGNIVQLKHYCLDDVRLTRDLYAYGKEHGKLIYRQQFAQDRVIPVTFGASLKKAAVHLTLGL